MYAAQVRIQAESDPRSAIGGATIPAIAQGSSCSVLFAELSRFDGHDLIDRYTAGDDQIYTIQYADTNLPTTQLPFAWADLLCESHQ